MPRPQLRTRRLRRQVLRLASGSGLTVHYRRAKVGASSCIRCGRVLSGVPAKRSSELSRLSKSSKRPQRMFGGQLCHACLQESLKTAVRSVHPA